jgi:hypothetical protein
MMADVLWRLGRVNVHQINVYAPRMIGFIEAANLRSEPVGNRAVGSSEHNDRDSCVPRLPKVEWIAVEIN